MTEEALKGGGGGAAGRTFWMLYSPEIFSVFLESFKTGFLKKEPV